MKLKEIQAYLRKEKLNQILLISPDINITYFTQIKPSFALLLVSSTSATLYLTKLDKKSKLNGIKVKILPKSWESKLKNVRLKELGINKKFLTVKYQDKLKKVYPKAKFKDISSKLAELRSQKTPEEIKKVTSACKITSEAFQALLKELPKNKLKTEQDVAFFLEKFIKNKGAELAFPTIVAIGKNAAIPHHQTSTKKLCRGFLLLDFGACYQNYCSDMSRVVFLGEPNKMELKRYSLLHEAQEEALSKVKEEISFLELDKAARKKLGKHAKSFVHRLGHGVGIEIHEHPHFDRDKVLHNHIFTIEPGIYFPNKFGLRIEDTVLFRKNLKILTKAPKELIIIKIKK